MKKFFLTLSLFTFTTITQAQVAINNTGTSPDASAMLDIQSTTKGALLPRMTWIQIQAITNPAQGLLVFDIGLKAYRMYDGKAWVIIGPKQFDLSDPPGAFSTNFAQGPGIAYAEHVAMAADGSVYVTGYFTSAIVLNGISINTFNTGSYDIFIAKYDASGNVMWAKKLDGNAYEQTYQIDVDATGNFFICGYFTGTLDLDPGAGTDNHTTTGGNEIFFAKYDGNGNLIWGRHIGGTGSDVANTIKTDGTGNVYLGGYFSAGPVDFDPGAGTADLTSVGANDIFFASYDVNGNYIYAKGIGSVNQDAADDLAFVNGNLVVVGAFSATADFDPGPGVFNLTSAGAYDVFFAEYNSTGSLLWAKNIGSTSNDVANAVSVDISGNIWLTGYSSDAATDMDFDPGPTVVILPNAGGSDAFLAKYSTAGNYVWGGYIGGSAIEQAVDIQTDTLGNVYVTGRFQGATDFDPSTSVVNLSVIGLIDNYIAKYNSSGGFVWAKSMGSKINDYSTGIAVSRNGKLIFSTGVVSQSPFKTFDGERVFSSNLFYLARYEE